MTTGVRDAPWRYIDPEARIGAGVEIGEGAIVRGPVELGDGVRLGRYCIVEATWERLTVLAARTRVDDFARLYPGVSVGAGSYIGSHVTLGHPSKAELTGVDASASMERVRDLLVPEPVTRIGPGAVVRSHSVIYAHVEIGGGFASGHFMLVREHTRIGERVVFGTHASVDGYSRIGDLCHIGQYTQLSQAARIGRGCFIVAQTVFSDNKRAIRDVSEDLRGAVVEDYVRIGTNCSILPAVCLGKHAFVGSQSVVTKDVPSGALAYGVPARVARMLTEQEIQEYVASVER